MEGQSLLCEQWRLYQWGYVTPFGNTKQYNHVFHYVVQCVCRNMTCMYVTNPVEEVNRDNVELRLFERQWQQRGSNECEIVTKLYKTVNVAYFSLMLKLLNLHTDNSQQTIKYFTVKELQSFWNEIWYPKLEEQSHMLINLPLLTAHKWINKNFQLKGKEREELHVPFFPT